MHSDTWCGLYGPYQTAVNGPHPVYPYLGYTMCTPIIFTQKREIAKCYHKKEEQSFPSPLNFTCLDSKPKTMKPRLPPTLFKGIPIKYQRTRNI